MKKLFRSIILLSAALLFGTVLFACNPAHTHTYSEDWSYDAQYHWHAATCEHTTEKKDLARHRFDKDGICEDCGCPEQHVHTLVEVKAKDPTCTDDGNIDYYMCKTCGLYFTDKTAEEEIHPNDVVIPATGHTYSEDIIDHDQFYHWNRATCEHDQERVNKALHNFNEDGVCTVCSQEAVYTQGLQYEESDTEAILVGLGDCKDSDIIVPETTPNGKPITSIGAADGSTNIAFSRTLIKSINLGPNITSITGYAFQDCKLLEYVSMTDNLLSLEEGVFSGCINLKSVKMSDAVAEFKDNLFLNCGKLESIKIGKNVTSIAIYAFNGCKFKSIEVSPENTKFSGEGNCIIEFDRAIEFDELERPTRRANVLLKGCDESDISAIETDIKHIAENAFINITSIKNLVLPEGLESIGHWAFMNCSNIETITMPESLKTLGAEVFSGCSKIKTLEIGKGITEIGNSCFANDYWLEEVNFLGATTTIKDKTFAKCRKLKVVNFPASLQSMGDEVFSDCSAIESVTIPDGVTNMGSYEFNMCVKLHSVKLPSSLTSISNRMFYGCSAIQFIDIPNSVTSIGENAFAGCSMLKSAVIGSGVSTIASGAFGDSCKKLNLIYFGGTKDQWTQIKKAGNSRLTSTSTKVYVFSENEPPLTSSGKYFEGDFWHYNESGEIEIWQTQYEKDHPI